MVTTPKRLAAGIAVAALLALPLTVTVNTK